MGVVKAQRGLCATAAMVFQECATRGFELDPELLVALNRIDMARQVWHKMPCMRETMANIWRSYQEHGHPAATVLAPFRTAPIPPPGWNQGRGWKREFPNWGPVGLLLQSARAFGLGIVMTSEGWTVLQRDELLLPICTEPPQTVRPRIRAMLQTARMAQVQSTRASVAGYRWMDPYLAKEVWCRIPEPDRGLWSVITSGQLATADRAARCGILSSDE